MTVEDAPLWMPILVSASVAVVVAVLGAVFTDVGPWYQALKKPFWQPPNWLFGPVWTTIFTLAVASSVILWRKTNTGDDQALIIGLFALNAVLNIAWSMLFFWMRRPDWALFEVALLWLSILAMIILFWRISPLASLLLLPYIAWVSVASFLNLTIIRMNEPFRVMA